VRAIASYEPGGDFIFPEGEAPMVPYGERTFTPDPDGVTHRAA
jgi:hypothetical protein